MTLFAPRFSLSGAVGGESTLGSVALSVSVTLSLSDSQRFIQKSMELNLNHT